MRHRNYRFVSWHAKSNVWVVSRGGKYYGCAPHDQEDRAADIAAKAFNMSHRDELRLDSDAKSKPQAKPSKFMFVHFAISRGKWYAQCRGKFLSQHDTEMEAARAVVAAGWASSLRQLRINTSSVASKLVLKNSKIKTKVEKAKVKKKSQIKTKAKGFSRERFRNIWLIYRDASGSKGVAALPGDVQDGS